MGVLAADQCDREGLTTPPLAPASRERLAPLVTPLASTANPLDLTPETYNQPRWLALFPQALDVIAADPGVDTVLFQVGATAHRAKELMDEIAGLRSRTGKMVAVAWALAPEAALTRFPAEGIYAFPETARAVRAVALATRYRAALAGPGSVPSYLWDSWMCSKGIMSWK